MTNHDVEFMRHAMVRLLELSGQAKSVYVPRAKRAL
jgi:hypothetical protein